jgi:cation diffusion facilitator family transporter
VVNLFVALYEHRAGRRLGSPFLVADAAHTASDVVVTIGVLISLGVARAGVAWADPVAALVVTVVIGRVAYKILVENFGVLLDQAALSVDDVRAIALAVPGVADCHRIRSRGAGGTVHLDLHLQVDGGLPLARAHEIAHDVEDRLRAGLPGLVDVTIHVEPEGDAEDPL